MGLTRPRVWPRVCALVCARQWLAQAKWWCSEAKSRPCFAYVGTRGAARCAPKRKGHADCVYCLEEFQSGDTVTFMPCHGKHLGHKQCTERWLAEASTCPVCRFPLPQSREETTHAALAELCKGAEAEKERVRNTTPMPSEPCQVEALLESEWCAECEDVDEAPRTRIDSHTAVAAVVPNVVPNPVPMVHLPRAAVRHFRAMSRQWRDSWWIDRT